MIPFTLLIVGLALMGLGIWFALKGRGSETAGGEAMRGIKIQGPAWLMMIAMGIGCIMIAGMIDFNDVQAPTRTVETTTTLDEFDDFETGEPYDFGDDPYFDDLWIWCDNGDGSACDELFEVTPVGSLYEDFGASCGWRFQQWILDCANE